MRGGTLESDELFVPLALEGGLWYVTTRAQAPAGVSLAKAAPTQANRHWPCVVQGEPQIDVSRFGEPVVAIDENRREDVSKYVEIMKQAQTGEYAKA